MNNCPYCSTVVDDQYNFCISCERQIRCIQCKSLLLAHKSKCLVCGSPLVTSSDSVSHQNEYSFEEERTNSDYKRQVRLKFTDSAIDKVGQYLPTYIFTGSSLTLPNKDTSLPRETPSLSANVGTEQPIPPVYPNSIQEEGMQQTVDSSKVGWTDKYIFRNGERLEIKLTDFKGKTRKDQMRRFILLFVWGYNNCFAEPVPNREPITQMAKELNVWDTTFSHLITQMQKDVLLKSDDGIRLTPGTDYEIKTILDELQDSTIKGFNLRSAKSSRKSGASQPKVDNKNNTLVKEWLQKPLDLGGYDVRELEKAQPRQHVQFGLWVLKNKLQVEHAYLDAVVNFTLQAFPKIGGVAKSMKNAVTNKKYVGRTPTGECYLTTEGENDIKSLLPESLKSS